MSKASSTEISRIPLFNWTLIAKCISDGKWLFIACAIALFAMCWLRAWAVSLISMQSFEVILDNLPKQFQQMFPVDSSWLVTYTGRVALAYEEPMIFLCLAIWCLARSSDCVSGQLGRGTMEMLLAQPISRAQLLLTHSAVTILGILLLSIIAWLGLMGAVHTHSVKEKQVATVKVPYTKFEIPIGKSEEIEVPLATKVKHEFLWHGSVNYFCAGLMLAGLTTLLSSLDRYRWRTLGIATGFYIVQSVIVLLASISPKLSWLGWLSVISNFKPSNCIMNAERHPELVTSLYAFQEESGSLMIAPLGFNLTLLAFALIAYVAAVFIFQRRDLPAPV